MGVQGKAIGPAFAMSREAGVEQAEPLRHRSISEPVVHSC